MRRHQASRRNGVAMTEFALMLPVFLVLLLGAIESAWVMYVRQSMNYATREAVRSMAVQVASSEEAEAFAMNYLNAFAPYDYTFSTSNPQNGDTVGMRIDVPMRDVALMGSMIFPHDTLISARTELVRETSYK